MKTVFRQNVILASTRRASGGQPGTSEAGRRYTDGRVGTQSLRFECEQDLSSCKFNHTASH